MSPDLTATARNLEAVYADTTMMRLVERLSDTLRRRAGRGVTVLPAEPGEAHLMSVVCTTRRARTAVIALLQEAERTVTQTADVVKYEGGQATKNFVVWAR